MLPFLALAACPTPPLPAEGTDEAGVEGVEGSGVAETGEARDTAPVAPEVLSVVTVSCEEQQSAGDVWVVQVAVGDPQGAETVTAGTVAVRTRSGEELAAYAMVCGAGTCMTTFRGAYDGVGCAMLGSVVLVFTATDEDGDASEPFEHAT